MVALESGNEPPTWNDFDPAAPRLPLSAQADVQPASLLVVTTSVPPPAPELVMVSVASMLRVKAWPPSPVTVNWATLDAGDVSQTALVPVSVRPLAGDSVAVPDRRQHRDGRVHRHPECDGDLQLTH